MSSLTVEKPPQKSRIQIQRQIRLVREQLSDLQDYLDLLDARVRNKGKRTFSLEEVRRQLGLADKGRDERAK
ncbi:MAG: hypothetical protein O2960_16840 [Verrucomicrobia bacterium]|nr:hypothetical protein [Verrucomicrobiota bacterium]